jgi:2-desacetyl-2-hydroxyethyl bacteriochlorophyllide A dehydrogenase
MKAAIFHGPGGSWPQKPISIEDIPVPIPTSGEVLIKVAACGLCRTDLEYLKVEEATPKPPPIILGHEPAGTVAGIGAGVSNVTVEQRVLIATAIPCLTCDFCRQGQQNLCPNMSLVGANRDGAFAEYVTAPATGVIPLPDSLPLEESAIITDAVSTSYHAVYNRARVKKGDTVVIYGASGGLGLICVQMASAIGARVIGIGRKKWKLEKTMEFGASEIISSEEVDSVDRAVKQISEGGADISIDVTGSARMIESACRTIRQGGRIIVIGFSFEKVRLSINRLMWQELNVMGSKNYCLSDMPAIIRLVENGVVTPGKIVSHRFKLEEINEAYRMLERGELLRGIVIP